MAKVSLRAYNREIETMIDSGHLDEAIANCRHILKTFPKHLETYRLLGKAYLEYKRYPEAADIFSRVLAAVPDDFVANVGMSIIRDEENRLDDAIWHMERAFETQPSNAAIQGELQRLYGRRDGVQPPRIRMTRGALAHMYVHGELYPQAISEIKSVLDEDAGRVDMQALLARAYYRGGLKNEAAEVASSVLRNYSYCLDANRVLMEILGSDRSESAQIYRQRVVELDPYAAHVTGAVFQSDEAPEAAVNVERLDWNGQPVALQPDWGTSQAISLEESGAQEGQPEWLRSVFDEPLTQPPPQPLGPIQDQPAVVPPFDTSAQPTPADSKEDIPDFLRAAGWSESTGAFDESKSPFTYEEPETEPPIAKGELPDWVKAMAPAEAQQTPDEEEELPDWINKIGTEASPASLEAESQLDWIRQLDQPAEAQPSDEQSDWMKPMDQPEASVPPASDDQPDWLRGFGSESESAPSVPAEESDWMSELEQPAQAESQPSEDQPDWLKQSEQPVLSASDDQPDWLKGFGSETESEPTDEPDWLKQIGEPTKLFSSPLEEPPPAEKDETAEPASSFPESGELDFLDQTVDQASATAAELSEPVLPGESPEVPQEPVPSAPSELDAESLGTSEQERDDSFAWLESLAAKQGASEGLLTKPEDRLEEEPDWIKQARGEGTDASVQPPSVPRPAESTEELGTSEQEREDSFAWLENLAAKQGASEGLLTRPEDRLEEEPDWIKKAREQGAAAEEPPASPVPVEEETPSRDDTGLWLRSLEQEDSTAVFSSEDDATGIWLKSLDEGVEAARASQPAGQTEPETPAWMQDIEAKQSDELSAPSAPVEEASAEVQPEQSAREPESEMPPWMQSIEQEQPAEAGAPSTLAEEAVPPSEQPEPGIPDWMQAVGEEKASEHEPTAPATESAPGTPEMQTARPAQTDDLPEWMQYVEDKEAAEEGAPATAEQEMAAEGAEWMGSIEGPVAASESPESVEEKLAADQEAIPAWLSGLEEEESQVATPTASDADLPAWLRGEAEAPAEPLEPEPTRPADWHPVEASQPEPPVPVVEEISEPADRVQETPEPVMSSIEQQEAESPASEPEQEHVVASEEAPSGLPVDPILGQAREDLERGDVSGALNTYGKLIKKTRLLDEVIYDLREALYRYPVDVSIWQSLGDAYMRANRLQDALDAYTKAEELLR
ncbi:MAG TPA: tetratricopeptide repeat protein [Anaerolineales bacterium]|nr:tetratricopeptide repeat protein [Anaerolineales bacterium]